MVKFLFFEIIHWITHEKQTAAHKFEFLTYCMSTTSYSTAPSVMYLNDISCGFKISVEISGEYV